MTLPHRAPGIHAQQQTDHTSQTDDEHQGHYRVAPSRAFDPLLLIQNFYGGRS
jgi:hypothetical protein